MFYMEIFMQFFTLSLSCVPEINEKYLQFGKCFSQEIFLKKKSLNVDKYLDLCIFKMKYQFLKN